MTVKSSTEQGPRGSFEHSPPHRDHARRRPFTYLEARGLRDTAPEALNDALHAVLDSMPPMIHDGASREMPEDEQAILRDAGFALERRVDPSADPLAASIVKYAAIVERSLSANEASEKLGLTPGRIRQMISDRSVYSFLIGHKRHIPDFQFDGDCLTPNIASVNRALPRELHPVAVYNWYNQRHVDLFVDGDPDITVSPLDWLRTGRDADRAVFLAGMLEVPAIRYSSESVGVTVGELVPPAAGEIEADEDGTRAAATAATDEGVSRYRGDRRKIAHRE